MFLCLKGIVSGRSVCFGSVCCNCCYGWGIIGFVSYRFFCDVEIWFVLN